MAEEALEIELRQETTYLAAYDRVTRAVNERYDVRGSDLSALVRSCLENNNAVSNHRRKTYGARVPAGVFDFIESEARAAYAIGTETEEQASGDAAPPGL